MNGKGWNQEHTDVLVIPHCAIRAKERYGLDLSLTDVRALSRRCLAGEGRTGGNEDGAQFHLLIHAERVLWVVYRPPAAGSTHPDGTILTIMPPEVASAMVIRDVRHKARRRGDYRAFRRWR